MDDRYAPPSAEGGSRSSNRAVFEYFVEPSATRSSAVASYVLISPVVVAMGFGMVGLPEYALPAAVLTGLVMWWRKRRAKKLPQATLFIDQARLRVVDRGARELLNVPLTELLEVELDTKTIQRVQESMSSGVPELRFLQSKVGSASDIARIVLVARELEVPLTEEQGSHSYALESFGQIRRFLRQNGWRPANERSPG